MGQSSAEIQLETQRKRNALKARAAKLEGRIEDDVSEAASAFKHDVSATLGTTKGSGTAIAQHPKPLAGGAFAAGLVLGLVTGAGDEERARSRGRSREGTLRSSGGEEAEGIVGRAAAATLAYLQGTAMSVVKESFDSMKKHEPAANGRRKPVRDDGKPSEARAHGDPGTTDDAHELEDPSGIERAEQVRDETILATPEVARPVI